MGKSFELKSTTQIFALWHQKIVIKVSMEDAKKRCKAFKIAAGLPGVETIALEGDERDRLVVVGAEIDCVTLMIMLRKKMAFVELVSVGKNMARSEVRQYQGRDNGDSVPVYLGRDNGASVPVYCCFM